MKPIDCLELIYVMVHNYRKAVFPAEKTPVWFLHVRKCSLNLKSDRQTDGEVDVVTSFGALHDSARHDCFAGEC